MLPQTGTKLTEKRGSKFGALLWRHLTPQRNTKTKFDLIRCNESPLRGEKPHFWPVSKNNTGSLPLRGILPVKKQTKKNKHHIFAPTAGARCTIFPKLCVVIELIVPIKKGVSHFSIQRIVFPTGCTEKFGLIYRRAVSPQ